MKKAVREFESGAELKRHLADVYGIVEGAAAALLDVAGAALDQALEAEKILDRDGLVIDGERGKRAHPLCAVSRDARNRMIAALGKLNLEL
jgi:hypothetical protein